MNENDKLEQLTDAELSEVFAVEVAGWEKVMPSERGYTWKNPNGNGEGNPVLVSYPPFAYHVDAVLPWLEKHNEITILREDGFWKVYLYVFKDMAPLYKSYNTSFPRAACVALIRAKRAEQQQTAGKTP